MKKLFTLLIIGSIQSMSVVHAYDSTKRFHAKKIIIPSTLIGLGFLTKGENRLFDRYDVRDWRNNKASNFRSRVDDVIALGSFLSFLPLGKNDLTNRTLLFLKSEALTHIPAILLKLSTDVMRPDGSNDESFPSGHTAQVFMAATFLHKEFGEEHPWVTVLAYSAATTVGAFRILNNKHWISDVLVGAGWGVASTNIVYAAHKNCWGKKSRLSAVPTYYNGPGLNLTFRL